MNSIGMKGNAPPRCDDNNETNSDDDSGGSGATWWDENFPKNIDMVSVGDGTHAFFDSDAGSFVADNGTAIYKDVLGFISIPFSSPGPKHNNGKVLINDKMQPSSKSEEGSPTTKCGNASCPFVGNLQHAKNSGNK